MAAFNYIFHFPFLICHFPNTHAVQWKMINEKWKMAVLVFGVPVVNIVEHFVLALAGAGDILDLLIGS
jgi:hypothetical protein